jgi:hypothetical protein
MAAELAASRLRREKRDARQGEKQDGCFAH